MDVLLIVYPGQPSLDSSCRMSTALDLAASLVRNEDTGVTLFLVGRAGTGSPTPVRLHALAAAGVGIRELDPRLPEDGTVPEHDTVRERYDVVPATVRDLAAATLEADRVLVF
ncbi:MAG: hypothetical protein ABIR11_06740 [Candidatus Limnocylindrales bacterium]